MLWIANVSVISSRWYLYRVCSVAMNGSEKRDFRLSLNIVKQRYNGYVTIRP